MTNKVVESTDNLITELIQNAVNVAVIPSKVAGADAFTAGIGLYYSLKLNGKKVSFVYPGKIPEGFENLIDVEEVMSDIKRRSLIVSIDYSNIPATKVHYTTKDDVLKLVLSPVSKDFDLGRISTELKGFDFDLIFTVGAQDLNDFGQTYRELQREFGAAKIVNLDNHNINQRFGTVDIVDTSEQGLCLLVLNKLARWGLKVDYVSAEALLRGISSTKLK
ncbi:hypothetical protein JXA34_00585 [Patescibacteria group bacterium]|nr:hypothetical protein [Patescibacteria group bacterium]